VGLVAVGMVVGSCCGDVLVGLVGLAAVRDGGFVEVVERERERGTLSYTCTCGRASLM